MIIINNNVIIIIIIVNIIIIIVIIIIIIIIIINLLLLAITALHTCHLAIQTHPGIEGQDVWHQSIDLSISASHEL